MNTVNLLGRLTRDLELKYSQSGMAHIGFTIAVNRQFQRQGEERQADFINCKAFGKTAEFISKYFRKGSMIAVEGRIQTGSYEKDGNKIYTTDVMVERCHFTGEKSNGGESGQSNQEPGFYPLDDGEADLPF